MIRIRRIAPCMIFILLRMNTIKPVEDLYCCAFLAALIIVPTIASLLILFDSTVQYVPSVWGGSFPNLGVFTTQKTALSPLSRFFPL